MNLFRSGKKEPKIVVYNTNGGELGFANGIHLNLSKYSGAYFFYATTANLSSNDGFELLLKVRYYRTDFPSNAYIFKIKTGIATMAEGGPNSVLVFDIK